MKNVCSSEGEGLGTTQNTAAGSRSFSLPFPCVMTSLHMAFKVDPERVRRQTKAWSRRKLARGRSSVGRLPRFAVQYTNKECRPRFVPHSREKAGTKLMQSIHRSVGTASYPKDPLAHAQRLAQATTEAGGLEGLALPVLQSEAAKEVETPEGGVECHHRYSDMMKTMFFNAQRTWTRTVRPDGIRL